jgi:hypothetical protein
MQLLLGVRQQFVPSHWDACSGYTITVPALSAIARSVCATTVTTAIPVVNAKVNAKATANFFMTALPLRETKFAIAGQGPL